MSTLKTTAALTSLFFVCTSAQASFRPLAQEPGWQFTVNVNAGVGQSQSQFNPEDDNAITEDLENSGQQVTKFIGFPLLRAAYTQEDMKTQWFLGNSLDNVSRGEFQLEAGVTHDFATGTRATVALFPDLPFFGKTWSDPYLVGKPRTETEQKNWGGRIALDYIWGSPVSVKYGYANNEVKLEQSGSALPLTEQQRDMLNRDGDFHRVEVEGFLPLAKGLFFQPSVIYTLADNKGEAMAYDEWGGRLALTYSKNKHRITTNVSYSSREYNGDNPIFENKRQEDEKLGLFALYLYSKPFGWEKASISVIAAWSQTDSNIEFYKSDVLAGAVGLAYRF
ncbi:DUF2860 family protein [Paraferrimonas haliotis]|uniref:DUF2860 domain-containing protein n=1 Tax=Paraferrimonas haliotis TaxID=2013866 RepID=A0AA37TM38_9GAMM|nr:DUF2860 family protein [Paraferrimonas haliotis]GLS84052.1 hypothetical protein GCM10007894_20290 [Paraferrimonas haliotis]